MSTAVLPPSARLAVWFGAWAGGRCSLDDARDAVVGEDAAHDVTGLRGAVAGQDRPGGGSEPLIVALGRLRAAGAHGAGLALPVPGDPLGLAGPAGFNADALEAGECVVLDGCDLGLVPHRTGSGVVWRVGEAVSHRQLPDPSEADAALRQVLLEASRRLAALDVARWRPEAADELMALRRPIDLVLPEGMSARAVRLVSLSARCRRIVELALHDDGASLTAAEADARRAALTPLDHAARRGLVAACAFPWDR